MILVAGRNPRLAICYGSFSNMADRFRTIHFRLLHNQLVGTILDDVFLISGNVGINNGSFYNEWHHSQWGLGIAGFFDDYGPVFFSNYRCRTVLELRIDFARVFVLSTRSTEPTTSAAIFL